MSEKLFTLIELIGEEKEEAVVSEETTTTEQKFTPRKYDSSVPILLQHVFNIKDLVDTKYKSCLVCKFNTKTRKFELRDRKTRLGHTKHSIVIEKIDEKNGDTLKQLSSVYNILFDENYQCVNIGAAYGSICKYIDTPETYKEVYKYSVIKPDGTPKNKKYLYAYRAYKIITFAAAVIGLVIAIL